MADQIFEQSFPVSGEAVFKLSNITGQVVVRQGEAQVIAVHAVMDDSSGNAEQTRVEMTQESSGRVVVETRFDHPVSGFLNRMKPCRVSYEVRLPAGVDVNISTIDSTQDLQGLQGKFHLSTISGSLTLADLTGELAFSTISGNVRASGLQAPKVSLSSISGEVEFLRSELGEADGSTVSGQIRVDAPVGAGPYAFRSVSGNVLWLAQTLAPCTLEVHTVSGDIQVNQPTTKARSERGSKVWNVLGGGPLIRLNSVSGNLQFRARQDAPAPERPTASGLTRKEILDKIESGEMTAEQALIALGQ